MKLANCMVNEEKFLKEEKKSLFQVHLFVQKQGFCRIREINRISLH